MKSLNLRAICIIKLFICCIGTGATQNVSPINSDAIIFPDAVSSLSNLPFLHVINLNIKDKVQLTKTPIQSSSEAFALDLIRVS